MKKVFTLKIISDHVVGEKKSYQVSNLDLNLGHLTLSQYVMLHDHVVGEKKSYQVSNLDLNLGHLTLSQYVMVRDLKSVTPRLYIIILIIIIIILK